jgi:hypothetical protein
MKRFELYNAIRVVHFVESKDARAVHNVMAHVRRSIRDMADHAAAMQSAQVATRVVGLGHASVSNAAMSADTQSGGPPLGQRFRSGRAEESPQLRAGTAGSKPPAEEPPSRARGNEKPKRNAMDIHANPPWELRWSTLGTTTAKAWSADGSRARCAPSKRMNAPSKR